MTSQLIVMNTGGIALASDSAMTINAKKVFRTANKIFGLSKEHPIGVMVYGTNSMFQVPWETIIKVYGDKLDAPFDTASEYAEGFRQFLDHNEFKEFMDIENEDTYSVDLLDFFIKNLHLELSALKEKMYTGEYIASPDGVFQEFYLSEAEKSLINRIRYMEEKPFPVGFDDHDYIKLYEKYAEIVKKKVYSKFEFHLYRNEWMDNIIQLAIVSLVKEFSENFSGIIFAGFGHKEFFPSMHLLIIDGKLNNKTKYSVRKKLIKNSSPAAIIPFAERDMVKSFLKGIHEETENFISAFFEKELNLLSSELIDQLRDKLKSENDIEFLNNKLSHVFENALQKYRQELRNFTRDNFRDPVFGVVESLPLKDLANLSESLLDSAVLKKRISFDLETVSGPVDVAVISKSKGFEWVKKK